MIPGIFATIVHHPLSYQAGPLQFTGFGLAMLLTFVIAQIISQHEMERRGHDGSVMSDLVFAAVIGGLLVSTFATLTILPSIYAILQRRASLTSPSLNPMDPASRYYDAN